MTNETNTCNINKHIFCNSYNVDNERGKRMSNWLEITLAIMGGLITLMTLWNLIEQRVVKTKEPTTNLEERVNLLEKKVDFEIKTSFERYDAMFGRDKARLDSNEEGIKVILKALLAMMKHEIDGNNTNELKKASDDLQEYMLKR